MRRAPAGLRAAGLSRGRITALTSRADRVARLAAARTPSAQVSRAAQELATFADRARPALEGR